MHGAIRGPSAADDSVALVERARRGDREAFARLVERYQGAVVATARALLANHHDAEEVAQETLVQAWRELPRLRDPGRFPRWLHRITQTRCSNFRTRWRQDTLPIDGIEWSGEHTSERAGRSDASAVQEAIASLSAANRLTTSLFYLGGYSIEEIAAMLEVPAGTVKRRLHDSRNRLKGRMAPLAQRRLARRPARTASPITVSPIAISTAAERKERSPMDMTPMDAAAGPELAIPAGALRAALRCATIAAARDDRRPVLNTVLFRWTPDGLTLAAADGYRVVNVTVPGVPVPAHWASDAGPHTVLLAARVAAALLRLIEGLSDTEVVRLVLSSDSRRVSMTAGDATLLSPLVDVDYPNVVPIPAAWQEWRTRVTVETAALRHTLRAARPAGSERAPLLLDAVSDRLRLYLRDAAAQFDKEGAVPAALEGTPQRVALNGDYLLQMLDASTSPQVHLSWGDPLKPMIVRDVGEPSQAETRALTTTWAVMPMGAAPSVMEHEFAAV